MLSVTQVVSHECVSGTAAKGTQVECAEVETDRGCSERH